MSSFMCDATNSHSHTSQHLSRQHTLLVFLFLTSPSTCENSRLSDSMQWKHQTELVHKLRVDFQELVMTYSKKFHQATHSALNKIACNYGSHSKVSEIHCLVLCTLSMNNADQINHGDSSSTGG